MLKSLKIISDLGLHTVVTAPHPTEKRYIQILERILQKKINAQKMAMKDRMVWAKYFESVSYESVEAEAISRKIEQMKTLLF